MKKMLESFGFQTVPFPKDLHFSELYRYPQLEELFERIQASVEDGAGMVISGRAGTGKTTAIRGYVESLGGRYRVIYLGQFQRGTALFAKLAMEFGIRKSLFSPARMVNLVQRISEESSSGRKLILVVDEAHLLERPTFEDLRLLTNSDMDRRSPMSLIVVGQRWLRSMLKVEALEALNQRLRLRFSLEGLSEKETTEYIRHHLNRAGCTRELFTPGATSLIFVASEGILREINNICYESLLVAHSKKAQKVDERIAAQVIDQRELS